MPSLKIPVLGLAAVLMALVLTAGCAYQASDSNYQDIGVIKTDTEGATLWDRTIDSGYTDALFRMTHLSDVVSATDGRVFVGYNLVYRPRSDPSMHMVWITCFGPDGEGIWNWSVDLDLPNDIAPAPDGGCVVVADTSKNAAVKIGPDGRTRWTVCASTLSFEPTAVASTAAGRYIVGRENALAWLDENGTVIDVKKYTEGQNPAGYVNTIVPMTDGGCAVVYDSSENPGVIRLNAGGEILWNTSGLTSTAENIDGYREILDVREIEEGGLGLLVVEGESGRDTGQIRDIVYGPDGAVLGEKTFAIPSGGLITRAPGGGYVIAAVEDSKGNPGVEIPAGESPSYVHLIKLNAAGHQEWDRTVGSRPGRYHVVSIGPAGADGYVVIVGEIAPSS